MKPNMNVNIGKVFKRKETVTKFGDRDKTIHEIVRSGNKSEAFEKLVDGGPVLLNLQDEMKQSPLHIASAYQHTDIIDLLLLHRGTNINSRDKNGQTPLQITIGQSSTRILKQLLVRGADPNIKNNESMTTIHLLMRISWSDIVKEALELILQYGGDIEAKNAYGETPLLIASSLLHTPHVEYLISKKTDVKSVNGFGESCLHKVARLIDSQNKKEGENAKKLLKYLLDNGADPSAKGVHGSAVDLIDASNKDIISLFASYGVEKKEITVQPLEDPESKLSWMETQTLKLKKERIKKIREEEGISIEEDIEEEPDDDSVSTISTNTIPAITLNSGTQSNSSVKQNSSDLDSSISSGVGVGIPEVNYNEKRAISEGVSPQAVEAYKKTLPPLDPNFMIQPVDGYNVEHGIKKDFNPSQDIILQTHQDLYEKIFYRKKHFNFAGLYSNDNDVEPFEPAIISVLIEPENGVYKAISRTKRGVAEFQIYENKITASVSNPLQLAEELLKELRTQFSGQTRFFLVDDPELREELLKYELHDPQKTTCFPVGVVYVKEGQRVQWEFWNNENGSERFDEFLTILGDKIETQGWSGYSGGLDVRNNTKGKHSIYTRWNGLELMFHVSTYLPYDPDDPQKLQRSRIIGNDVTMILFIEGQTPYHPLTMTGAVSHVFAVVHEVTGPTGKPAYKFAVTSHKYVPQFNPPLPDPPIFEDKALFREFLLTKIVNGHFSAQRSVGLARMYSRPRGLLLNELVKNYTHHLEKKAKGRLGILSPLNVIVGSTMNTMGSAFTTVGSAIGSTVGTVGTAMSVVKDGATGLVPMKRKEGTSSISSPPVHSLPVAGSSPTILTSSSTSHNSSLRNSESSLSLKDDREDTETESSEESDTESQKEKEKHKERKSRSESSHRHRTDRTRIKDRDDSDSKSRRDRERGERKRKEGHSKDDTDDKEKTRRSSSRVERSTSYYENRRDKLVKKVEEDMAKSPSVSSKRNKKHEVTLPGPSGSINLEGLERPKKKGVESEKKKVYSSVQRADGKKLSKNGSIPQQAPQVTPIPEETDASGRRNSH